MALARFHRANAKSFGDANIVVMGVPDESRSHAMRRGTSTAPDTIRAASDESEFFVRDGRLIPTVPMRGTLGDKRIFDAGNVQRNSVYEQARKIVEAGKIPVTLGGDHSLTTDILKAVAGGGRKVALLYFDAHPDFVSSARNYYGSVLTDSANCVDYKKSMLVGTRAAEPEEIENAKKAGLAMVTPIDITDLGVHKVAQMIREKVAGSRVYISIDLDCVDPAFAPGVSVPSPGGVTIADLLYLLTGTISNCDVAGFDIVELSPDYDADGLTANLAARILTECIACLKTS
ncbi:arginase family protein [Candidatus Nitrososphaera evergladensis]|uniref:arginase family protein n=1 Tax=Candidatus Nitrososphaera evergladensis TaxID=1459637 RepID=UPI0011E5BDAF|nr:arginase family protein [Candidatus Nitrososphaera evergladensis]